MNSVMAEMFGKSTGCSRGRGGSMHLFDSSRRFFGGNAIVGGGIPIAVGLALADRALSRSSITACFLGDGATAEGIFHESMNLAALWKLPVLFLCENNRYAMGTSLERSHSQWENLLPHVNPAQELYPGWTIRQLLAHLTGWDENTLATLTAHQNPKAPHAPEANDFDEFNARAVSSREALDLNAVLQEWRTTRLKLVSLLREMPEESYRTTLITSWGERLSVPGLIQVFIDHEASHVRDLQQWLKDPSKPLRKRGN